jgi:hypothetical protein
MKPTLEQHLMSLNGEVLKGWLQRVNALEKGTTRKEQWVRGIQKELTCNLAGVLERLTLEERCLLAECSHQGRFVSAREFEAKYNSSCPMPRRQYSWREQVSLLVPFISIPTFRDDKESCLIAQLEEPLRALLPKPQGVQVRSLERLPKAWPAEQQCLGGDPIRSIQVFESERLGPAELARVLRLIQGGKVKVTDANRRPTDASTRLIAQTLVVPDFSLEVPEADKSDWQKKYYTEAGAVRAHAWPVLVQQCGWARSKAGMLTLTAEGKDILQQFTPEKLRSGVSSYFVNNDFDELNRISHIRGQTGKGRRCLSQPAARKLVIKSVLQRLPPGQWFHHKECNRLVDAQGQNWDALKSDYPALYFFEPQFGFISDHSGLNSQFLRAVCMESLATLGVLDVGCIYPHNLWPDLKDSLAGDLPFCGRYDGLLYIRLNPLGAYALGCTETYAYQPEVKPKPFRVLPNLDVVLLAGPLNPADRASLELLAAPKSEMVWTLDAERMLTHLETGGAFKELRAFLEENAAESLPPNVQTFLQGLEDKTGACQSSQEAVLLEWSDEALAQLIATSTGTNRLCFHAGENRLVVPRKNLAAFSRAVKRLGYALPNGNPGL